MYKKNMVTLALGSLLLFGCGGGSGGSTPVVDDGGSTPVVDDGGSTPTVENKNIKLEYVADIPTHDFTITSKGRLYFVDINDTTEDRIYIKRYNEDGSFDVFMFNEEWDLGNIYSPYNPRVIRDDGHTGISTYYVEGFAKKGDDFYFATADNIYRSDRVITDWKISFDDDGTPLLSERISPERIVCDQKDKKFDLCATSTTQELYDQIITNDDQLSNNLGRALWVGGKYVFIGGYFDDDAKDLVYIYDKDLVETTVPIVFDTDDGTRVADYSDVELHYNETLNSLLFVKQYSGGLDLRYVLGVIDLNTNTVRTTDLQVTRTTANYDGNVVVPTKDGFNFIVSIKHAFSFNATDMTTTKITMDYPLGHWPVPKNVIKIADDEYYIIDEVIGGERLLKNVF